MTPYYFRIDTMSRAILADAVALVRSDCCFMYDSTRFNLATLGFLDGNRSTSNASWGGVLGKLFARALPRHFNVTSAFTHFPLLPIGHTYSMDKVLSELGRAKEECTFTRPVKSSATILISDTNGVFNGAPRSRDGSQAKHLGHRSYSHCKFQFLSKCIVCGADS